MKAGVTRNQEIGQGNGLAGTLRIATMSGGHFDVASGTGVLLVSSDSTQSRRLHFNQAFPGTVVNATILRNADFKISEALGFTEMIGGVFDLIESQYETEDGEAFLVRMAMEDIGFGSREAGRQIRTKLNNLLSSDARKPVLIDWDGVPVISSSFADEAIGKLFIELGPITFMSRVRNIKMENLIRGLIDKAIMQRTAQSMKMIPRD